MTLKKGIYILFAILFIGGSALSGQSHFTITSLDINTRSKELAPAFFKDGLVFCSDRRNEFLMSYTDYNNTPLTNLYFSQQKKNGRFENASLFAKELTTFMYEGPACFSADGDIVYITRSIDVSSRNKNSSRRDTTLGIFISRKVNGNWSNPVSFRFNSAAYNTGYPFINNEGNMLFFCSDAPGGMGGLDIYVSDLKGGSWSEPQNLGPVVNTSGNEVFPFLHHDGRLYFASRGLNNKGDLDIYYTVKKEGAWQKPVRLQEPFNTKDDDYGLIFNASSDTGYFVSDRNGSPDIFAAYSGIPTFTNCPVQKENDYCFVFYEANNDEVDTTTYAFEWDMGDGTRIRALEAEHCFAESGNYLVQLNIIDKVTKDVMISQASYSFTVDKIEQPYISLRDTVSAGEEIALSGSETFLKDYTIQNYYWDFGDGTRLQGVNTKHTFNFPGTYEIKLGITGQSAAGEPAGNQCVSRRIVVLEAKN